MKNIIIATLCILIGSCTNPEKAVEVLQKQGYTNIEITGYEFGACSEEDVFHTGFIAVSPSGYAVGGVVCSGLLKGSTIRFE